MEANMIQALTPKPTTARERALKLRAAAQRFNNGKLANRGHDFSFNKIFSLLLDVEQTNESIGDQMGISGEAVEQMIQLHFAEFLPVHLRTGRARQKKRTELRLERIKSELGTYIDNTAAGRAAKLAKAQGLKYQRIVSADGYINRHYLFINGIKCYVKLCSHARSLVRNGRRYYVFRFVPGRVKSAGLVILIADYKKKSIPYFFKPSELNCKLLFIPEVGSQKSPAGCNPKHGFNFEEHRDRWDQCQHPDMATLP